MAEAASAAPAAASKEMCIPSMKAVCAWSGTGGGSCSATANEDFTLSAVSAESPVVSTLAL